MSDYSDLVAEVARKQQSEERQRIDQERRDQSFAELLKQIETNLATEMQKAEDEFSGHGLKGFAGPVVSKSPWSASITFSEHKCTIQIDRESNMIRATLLADGGRLESAFGFVYEGNRYQVYGTKAGVIDRDSKYSPRELARKLIVGTVRGRFD